MTIPASLPLLIATQKNVALQRLLAAVGQTLEAEVVGPALKGATEIRIAGQSLAVMLHSPAKPGERLQMAVSKEGQGVRLALVGPTLAPKPQGGLERHSGDLAPVQQGAWPKASAVPSGTAPPAPATRAAPMVSAEPRVGAPAASPVSSAVALPPRAAPTPADVDLGAIIDPKPAKENVVQQALRPMGASQPAVSIERRAASASTQVSDGVIPKPVGAPAPQALPPSAAKPELLAYQRQLSPASASLPASAPGVPIVSGQPQATQGKGLDQIVTGGAAAHHRASPALPPTEGAALAQMVQAAVPRQASMSTLVAALSSLAGTLALPEVVEQAGNQVLRQVLPLDGKMNGKAMAAAALGSGVFQEASLASGQVPTPMTDLKSALLNLRTLLTAWVGPEARIVPVKSPPPPVRGVHPRAVAVEVVPLPIGESAHETGQRLLDQTEGALHRLRLHQHASLPDAAPGRPAEWTLELPVVVGQHMTMLQLQVQHDAEGVEQAAAERGWTMRFALSLPDMGEVGAQVSLRGGSTGVTLWAAEGTMADQLNLHRSELDTELTSMGFNVGRIHIRRGIPNGEAVPAGQFVDANR